MLTLIAVSSNVFVNNWLKEIKVMQSGLPARAVCLRFQYIPTQHDAAGRLSRGISSQQFNEIMSDWLRGPDRLCQLVAYSPTGNLGCIPKEYLRVRSASAKPIIACSVQDQSVPLVKFSEYSSYKKILDVVYKIFLACSKFKGWETTESEIKLKAFNYLAPCVQRDEYSNVLVYLDGSVRVLPIFDATVELIHRCSEHYKVPR